MRMKLNGNKRDTVSLVYRSDEASVTIPIGAPICLVLDGTDDGLAAILPSGSAAKAHAVAFGVSLGAVAPGIDGEAQVFGFCLKTSMLLQTRAATTDSWSASTQSLGVLLNIDTVNNVFSTSGGTLAKTSYLPFAVLAESSAIAASASATSDTRTVNTGYLKTFLRMM